MAALGISLVWVSYTTGLYAWCLWQGYDVTPKQLLSSTWPPGNPAKQAGKAAGDAIQATGKALNKGA